MAALDEVLTPIAAQTPYRSESTGPGAAIAPAVRDAASTVWMLPAPKVAPRVAAPPVRPSPPPVSLPIAAPTSPALAPTGDPWCRWLALEASPEDVRRRVFAAFPEDVGAPEYPARSADVTATSFTLVQTAVDARARPASVRVEIVAQAHETRLVVRWAGFRVDPYVKVALWMVGSLVALRVLADPWFAVMVALIGGPMLLVLNHRGAPAEQAFDRMVALLRTPLVPLERGAPRALEADEQRRPSKPTDPPD